MRHTDLRVKALDRGGQAGDDVCGVFALDEAGALDGCGEDAHEGAGQGQDGDECGAHVDGFGLWGLKR